MAPSKSRSAIPPRRSAALGCGAIALACANFARADESGVSFWLPGTYDSLAAVANQPGWAFAVAPYHAASYAGSNISAARLVRTGALSAAADGDLSANSEGFENTASLTASYGFAAPDLGAQIAFSVSSIAGRSSASETGALFASLGPQSLATPFSIGDLVTGFGDLAPQLTVFWNKDVHNFMLYGTGNVPVGAYEKTRLSNLGIGHAAVDGGGGYTFLDSKAGYECSAVAGFTYNLANTATSYKTGVDFHLDLAASKYLTESFFVGPVGYVYEEIGCDSGAGRQIRLLSIARRRSRPWRRLQLSAWRDAGLCRFEGLWRVRRGEPRGRLECAADAAALAAGGQGACEEDFEREILNGP